MTVTSMHDRVHSCINIDTHICVEQAANLVGSGAGLGFEWCYDYSIQFQHLYIKSLCSSNKWNNMYPCRNTTDGAAVSNAIWAEHDTRPQEALDARRRRVAPRIGASAWYCEQCVHMNKHKKYTNTCMHTYGICTRKYVHTCEVKCILLYFYTLFQISSNNFE